MQLVLTLPAKSDLPVFIQVAEALKDSIHKGILKPGDRLPSTRELSGSLKLARLTITSAYEHLASQNYINVVQGSGAFVLEPPAVTRVKQPASQDAQPIDAEAKNVESIKLSPWAQRLMAEDSLTSHAPDTTAELNHNAALLQVLPTNLWRKALFKSLDMEDSDLLTYTADPMGFQPLRQALAEYLGRARNISCSPEQIAIFCNTEAGTDKLARALLQSGDLVGVEEPGSPGVRTTFLTHGCRLMSLPVDGEGIMTDQLVAGSETPRLVYLTPSHQDPTGAPMSLPRRKTLLDWAKDRDCLIIEDDYDCEYYYGQRTLPALMSMDRDQRVIYRFNFWKSLFPLVRMGFLVLPESLVPVITRAKMLTERDNSLLEQKALASFISLGYFERHLSRTLGVYKSRRAAVIHALTRYLKQEVQVAPTTAGTHLLANFSEEFSPEKIVSSAARAGVPLVSTDQHYAGTPKRNEFMISFAILNEEEADKIFGEFALLLRQ